LYQVKTKGWKGLTSNHFNSSWSWSAGPGLVTPLFFFISATWCNNVFPLLSTTRRILANGIFFPFTISKIFFWRYMTATSKMLRFISSRWSIAWGCSLIISFTIFSIPLLVAVNNGISFVVVNDDNTGVFASLVFWEVCAHISCSTSFSFWSSSVLVTPLKELSSFIRLSANFKANTCSLFRFQILSSQHPTSWSCERERN